jgi:Xaa-Pro aminopeptidase
MSAPFGPDWAGREYRVRALLPSLSVDALVVSTPVNIRYLTGFSGSAGLLVISGDASTLIVDGRYQLSVRQGVATGAIAGVRPALVDRRYDLTLGEVLIREGASRVGFEASHVTVAQLSKWQSAAPATSWVPLEQTVERLRQIKDAREVEIFRRGGRLISAVAEGLGAIVRQGRTEREIAADLEGAILTAGFSKLSFPSIVASGPNSALPHAVPTDRRVGPGDLVVLDFGGVLDGYCLDLTRMAAAGRLSNDAKSLFDGVLAAHAAGVAAVRPGCLASDVDRAAREVLESRGLGEAFSHSTGHGLGLEVHEAPKLGKADPDARDVLSAGMVVTIEPGAYLETVGGARVEDDVLVTETGSESLTTASRSLLLI